LLLALNGFFVVVLEMPIVARLESKGKMFPLIILGVLCVPVSFLFLEFGNGLIVFALIYTLIITLSEIFAMPFMMNYALSRGGKQRKGEYSALYSIAYGVSLIVAPTFGLGLAARYGFDFMLHAIMALSAMTALGFFLLWKYKGSQDISGE
jgi:predicted MFS family arabinose efflux permease